jgi:hypothetical protein
MITTVRKIKSHTFNAMIAERRKSNVSEDYDDDDDCCCYDH